MATVPTFENLSPVAPRPPSVVPQQGVDRFQRQDLEQAGEGLSSLGRGVEGAARDASNIAANMATEQNIQTAKTAATQHQQYVNNLGFTSLDGQGGPAFYAMKGQDAINAAPTYLAAIQAQRDQAAEGMPQQAKNAYMAQTDGDIARETDSVRRHVMVQTMDAATGASQARIGSATDTAVLNYNNPNTISAQATVIHSEAVDEARRQGWAPNADGTPSVQQTQYEAAHLSPMYRDVVAKNLSSGDVAAAADAFNKYGQFMTRTDNVQTQQTLKAPLLKLHAQQQGDMLIGPQASSGGGGSMDQPYQMGAGYYDAVHGGEGNGTNAKTGASGPVQVIPSTAADFHAAPGNAGVDLSTEAGGRAFTKWYGDQNAQKISTVTGQPATMGQVVSAHLLGFEGAKAILTRPDEPIGKTLGEAATRNNPGPLPGGVSMTGAEAQKSITNYYAKAAGMNVFAGPGTPPTPASVAAEKPPRPDFEGAIGRVANDPNDPDLHNATVGYITERKNAYDMGEAVERDNMEKTVIPQTLNALENGAVGVPIPELAIRRAYGPNADAKLAELNDARTFGTLANANKYATPNDINGQIAKLNARINPENTDASDVAQAVKGRNMLLAVTKRNDEALKADPFSYVRQEPGVNAAFAAAQASGQPEDYARAIKASEAKQAYLGAIPQAVSTNGLRESVAKIHQAPVEAVPGIMSDLRKQYGSAWPDVFRDLSDPAKGKLDPTYQTFATIPQSGAVPIDYAAALKAKADKGEKFGSGMKAQSTGAENDLETRLTSNMAQWQSTFQPGSGDNLIAGQRNSIRTLATYYADDRGMSPTNAADAAYKAIIGDNMTMAGSIRAPKTINGQPFTTDMVQTAGRGVQDSLTDAKLQTGITASQAKHGKWVTDQDGMSATLQVQNTTGTWRTVRDADNKPVTMDYRRLPTPNATPAPDLVTPGSVQ